MGGIFTRAVEVIKYYNHYNRSYGKPETWMGANLS